LAGPLHAAAPAAAVVDVLPATVVVELDLFELDPHAANTPVNVMIANSDNNLRITRSLVATGWSGDAETLFRGGRAG
jgi:hypothetical protein